MNIFEQAIERAKGMCEVCGSPGNEIHHCIFGSGKKKQCERLESIILLCYECHRGTYGVHGKNGSELNLRLKQKLQITYQKLGLKDEELRYWLGGRYYL